MCTNNLKAFIQQREVACVVEDRCVCRAPTATCVPTKAVIFLDSSKQPLCVVSRLEDKICQKQLARKIHQKRVHLAGREDAERLSGFRCGLIAPFGHQEEMTTILDSRIFNCCPQDSVHGDDGPILCCGSGKPTTVLHIRASELARACRASVANLSKGALSGSANKPSSSMAVSRRSASDHSLLLSDPIPQALDAPQNRENFEDAAMSTFIDERGVFNTPVAPIPTYLARAISAPIPAQLLAVALHGYSWLPREVADDRVSLVELSAVVIRARRISRGLLFATLSCCCGDIQRDGRPPAPSENLTQSTEGRGQPDSLEAPCGPGAGEDASSSSISGNKTGIGDCGTWDVQLVVGRSFFSRRVEAASRPSDAGQIEGARDCGEAEAETRARSSGRCDESIGCFKGGQGAMYDPIVEEECKELLRRLKRGQMISVLCRPQRNPRAQTLDLVCYDLAIHESPAVTPIPTSKSREQESQAASDGVAHLMKEGVFLKLDLEPSAVRVVADWAGLLDMAQVLLPSRWQSLLGRARQAEMERGYVSSGALLGADMDVEVSHNEGMELARGPRDEAQDGHVHWLDALKSSHPDESSASALPQRAPDDHDLIVGVDAEWRPGRDSKVSLLQLACSQRAFLVDLLVLCSSSRSDEHDSCGQDDDCPSSEAPSASRWLCSLFLGLVLGEVFSAPWILKVGYGGNNDLARLRRSWPALSDTMGPVAASGSDAAASFIDVRELVRAAQAFRLWSGHPVQVETGGLSRLVQQVLGLPLDKTEQTSDWETRPLSQSQMNYAGLDAHCLVRVVDAMCPVWKLEQILDEASVSRLNPSPPEGGLAPLHGAATLVQLYLEGRRW